VAAKSDDGGGGRTTSEVCRRRCGRLRTTGGDARSGGEGAGGEELRRRCLRRFWRGPSAGGGYRRRGLRGSGLWVALGTGHLARLLFPSFFCLLEPERLFFFTPKEANVLTELQRS
jgi:hypothetical protein